MKTRSIPKATRPAGGVALALVALLTAGCASTSSFEPPQDAASLATRERATVAAVRSAIDLSESTYRSRPLLGTGCATDKYPALRVGSSVHMTHQVDRDLNARLFGLDEKVRVMWAAPDLGLAQGDVVVELNGETDARRMMQAYVTASVANTRAVTLRTASGKRVEATPFDICKGITAAYNPTNPTLAHSHAIHVHPLEVWDTALTPEERMWIVAWGQGLTATTGGSMRAAYVGTALGTAILVVPLSAVTQNIAGAAMSHGSRGAATAAGIQGYGAADAWAFNAMRTLGYDPVIGLHLHEKFVAKGSTNNAFALSPERLAALVKRAQDNGYKVTPATPARSAPLPGVIGAIPAAPDMTDHIVLREAPASTPALADYRVIRHRP